MKLTSIFILIFMSINVAAGTPGIKDLPPGLEAHEKRLLEINDQELKAYFNYEDEGNSCGLEGVWGREVIDITRVDGEIIAFEVESFVRAPSAYCGSLTTHLCAVFFEINEIGEFFPAATDCDFDFGD